MPKRFEMNVELVPPHPQGSTSARCSLPTKSTTSYRNLTALILVNQIRFNETQNDVCQVLNHLKLS